MASIYKQGKTWTVKVSIPLGNGIYTSKYETGFHTKNEAKVYANKLEEEKKNGTVLKKVNTSSFADYFDEWFETYKRNSISTSTANLYQYTSKVVHANFDKPIDSITRKEFQSFLNSFGADKAKTTVKKVRSHIRQALLSAKHDGVTDNDFTEDTVLIFGNKGHKPEDKYWNSDEVEKVIAHLDLKKSLNDIMIYTALQTGARFSEINGLTPSDINKKESTLSINKTWNDKQRKFNPTKNEQSNRTIKISVNLVNILNNLTPLDDHLFASKITNRPPASTTINQHLKRLEKEIGVKEITFHGLRHTHASLLLANDVLIQYISERLGHENVNITLDVYAHLINEKRDIEEDKTTAFLDKF